MKKTAKLFGAVVLSAALACGTVVPAFAADDPLLKTDPATDMSEKGTTTDVTKGNAKTYINIKTDIDQLNVTVPLHMTFVAKVSGGKLSVPSNYGIENNSSMGIKVTNVTATQSDMNWELTDQVVDNTTACPNGKIGKINLVASAGGTDVTVFDAVNSGVTNPTGWTVAKPTSSATAAPKLTIDWSKSATSKLGGTYKDQGTPGQSVSLDAFQIAYTIAGDAGTFTGNDHAE